MIRYERTGRAGQYRVLWNGAAVGLVEQARCRRRWYVYELDGLTHVGYSHGYRTRADAASVLRRRAEHLRAS